MAETTTASSDTPSSFKASLHREADSRWASLAWLRYPWRSASHEEDVVEPTPMPESSAGSRLLRRAIMQLDSYLRDQQGIREFTADQRCILRYSLAMADTPVPLPGGSYLMPGELFLDLHLWNEHVPPMPRNGPDLPWALGVRDQFRHSLGELAEALVHHRELQGVRACRARTNFAARHQAAAGLHARLAERFGFEAGETEATSLRTMTHDILEDILIGALVWTFNPAALRRDKLRRDRHVIWITRDRLLRHHGSASSDAASLRARL